MPAQRNSRTAALGIVLAFGALVPVHGQTVLTTDPYVPLSPGAKARIFGRRIIEPTSLAKSAFTSWIDQMQTSPVEWGRGMSGYGRRYSHKMANRGFENTI